MSTINGSTSSSVWTFKLEVIEVGTSIENNTSHVQVDAYIGRASNANGSYMYGASISCPVSVTGCSTQTITYNNASRVDIASGGWLYIGSAVFESVPHNDDGSKTISVSASFTNNISPSSGSASGTVALTTIPRKSSMTVSDGTLGTAQTLTVSRKSTSFTHTITYSCGSYSGTICSKSSSTSISWTPPIDFAFGAPNGTQVYVSFVLDTYNGNTLIGSNSYAIWCTIPDNVKPSVSITVEDTNNHKELYGKYIQGQSRIRIKVNASGIYGSSITSYNTSFDGKTYAVDSFVTSVISKSGTLSITTTVTDSRGRSATTTQNVDVFSYSPPKIKSLVIKRTDANGVTDSSGDYLTVIFNTEVSTMDNKNGVGYGVSYKKTTEPDSAYVYTDITEYTDVYSVKNGMFTFPADKMSSYNVKFYIADQLKQEIRDEIGNSISYLFSILKKGLGWAFGKIAELENTFEVALDSIFYKNVQVNGVLNAKSQQGNTVDVGDYADYGYVMAHVNTVTDLSKQSTIPFVLQRQVGSHFTVDSDGGIRVGANVQLVRVTACIGGSAPNGRGWLRIRIGSNDIVGSDAIAYGDFFTVHLSAILTVRENNIIYVYAPEEISLYNGGVGCYVYVERIK